MPELLVSGMKTVANRYLRHFRNQGLRVAQQQVHDIRVLNLIFHKLNFETKTLSGALNDSTVSGGFAAHEQGNAYDTFVTWTAISAVAPFS